MEACLSNEELIKSCSRMDPQAWKEFVCKVGPLIFGTSRKILVSRGLSKRIDIADEVYQEVFLDIIENDRLAKLKKPELLYRLIQSIAISRTLDRIRRLHSYESSIAEIPRSDTRFCEIPDVQIIIKEEFKNLNKKELLIMQFYLYGELKHREIADVLDLPIDTVSTVVRRSKEKIRLSLKDKGIYDI